MSLLSFLDLICDQTMHNRVKLFLKSFFDFHEIFFLFFILGMMTMWKEEVGGVKKTFVYEQC